MWFRRSRSCLVTRAALRAISFRGAFPPVLLLAVCIVFAVMTQKEVTKERERGLKLHVRATHLGGGDARRADDGGRCSVRTRLVGEKQAGDGKAGEVTSVSILCSARRCAGRRVV